MVEYITKDETIIFSPYFNKLLNGELLINYKKIIFSDYELTYQLFDRYENNNFSSLNYISSKFNQSLGNSLNNLVNLTHLTLGNNFNQSLGNSLDNLINLTHLTHLTFNWCFNQQLSNSKII